MASSADLVDMLSKGPSKAPGKTAPAKGEDDSPEVDAARDLLAAIEAKDAKALSLALRRAYEACEDSPAEEAAEDEEV